MRVIRCARTVAVLALLSSGCTDDSHPMGGPATPPPSTVQPAATATAADGPTGCPATHRRRLAATWQDRRALAGDFDGDGRSDLAVANRPANEDYDPSQVVELLSGRDGQPRCHAVFTAGGSRADRPFGTSVATGDFDADGYADLAVGTANTSTVTVLYGSPVGLTERRLVRLRSHRTSFGRDLVVADLDADGHDDLAVGAPHDDGSAGSGHAPPDEAVVVVWGGRAPLSVHRAYAIKPPTRRAQWFGQHLAAGDVTGDGYPELFATYNIFSRDSGQIPAGKVRTTMTLGTRRGPRDVQLLARRDGPMSVGDLTGDGVGDLALGIGCRRPGANRCPDGGEVLLFAGSHGGLGDPTRIREDDPAVGGEARPGNAFGGALLVTKLGGEPVLVVGSRPGDVSRSAASRFYFVVGGSSGLHRSSAYPPITGSRVRTVGTGALATRDVNGDGRRDLLSGSYGDRHGSIDVRFGRAGGGLSPAQEYFTSRWFHAWT